jgi:hypothetical protein
MGPLRYCLQGKQMYLPRDQSVIEAKHRLAWIRVRVEGQPWLATLTENEPLPFNPVNEFRDEIGLGFVYSRRHSEEEDGRRAVAELCSQELINAIDENPESLDDLSKRDFERLVAELYARMGFEVDLSRQSKDDGLDFLAVRSEGEPPFVLVVQCKHPDTSFPDRKRNKVGVRLMRELYGTATWNNVPNCLMITSSEFTTGAKRFADAKSQEIQLADRVSVLKWISKYRWNADE